MSGVDYSHLFRCGRCNNPSITFLLKYTPKKIIVKQNCPLHGKKAFVIPLSSVPGLLSVIRDSIFRCYKCGKPTVIDNIKRAKTWTLIRGNCETHKNSLPYQKISTNIYEMLNKFEEPHSVSNESENNKNLIVRYCSNCGYQVDPNQKACKLCGAAIMK